jgi:galactosylceramidase
VWKSDATAQFVKQSDITPINGTFSLSVNGASIYSISTTTGQQKGTFTTPIPPSAAMPIPFYDNYDHYSDAKLFGYLPYYTADICGVFEIANRPDGTGKCLRQVVGQKANGWAPEGAPFTIIGSRTWTDYEVSADVYFDNSGWAAVMGRISGTMNGYGAYPQGYRLRLASNGDWGLYYANGAEGDGTSLATGNVTLTGTWHNIKLRMSGSTLTCFIENNQVTNPAITDSKSGNGLAGLGTGSATPVWTSSNQKNPPRNTAMFDNFIIDKVGGTTGLAPTTFSQDATPPYGPSTSIVDKQINVRMMPVSISYKVFSNQFSIPKEIAGKNISASVYDLKGKLVQKVITNGAMINLGNKYGKSNEVFIVKLKVLD